MLGIGKLKDRVEELELEADQQENQIHRLSEQVLRLQESMRTMQVALDKLSSPVLSAGNPYHPSLN